MNYNKNGKLILFLEKYFPVLLSALAVWPIIVIVFIVASRISYPYTLERMEGASLLQVIRLLNNFPLYTQPSIEYVPLIYPPLYFYISALFTQILGTGFLALRLVSVLSFAGCLIFVFKIIKSISKDNFASLIGVGLFAATYPLSGAWFDIARVDTLFVLFCIMGIFYSSGEKTSDLILAGIFWSLAVFTKQTTLIVLFLSFAFFLIQDFKKAILRITITGIICLLFYAICIGLWGQWFDYYFFYLPTFHKTLTNIKDISTAVLQLALPLSIAFFVSFSPFLLDKNMRSKQSPVFFYIYITCAMLGLSLLGRLNLGGYTNVYMPAHIMISVMFGIGIHWWKNKIYSSKQTSPSLPLILFYSICALQMLTVFFDPRLVIPHASLERSWSNLESFIRATDGDVLAPEINYLNHLAGRNSFANQVAVEEIFGKYGNPEVTQRDLLEQELSQDLQNKRFRFILLKDMDGAWSQVESYYQCTPFSENQHSESMPPVLLQAYTICYP